MTLSKQDEIDKYSKKFKSTELRAPEELISMEYVEKMLASMKSRKDKNLEDGGKVLN